MVELLLGCGNKKERRINVFNRESWSNLTTLDIDPSCGADVEWDLERLPLPFPDNSFDEIHAYHVLEHVGIQGDFRFFFAQWEDFWRLLRPGGVFCGIQPEPGSVWAWADPGHRRVILPETLIFLDRTNYSQVGETVMADYRKWYNADFALGWTAVRGGQFYFVLEVRKPVRA